VEDDTQNAVVCNFIMAGFTARPAASNTRLGAGTAGAAIASHGDDIAAQEGVPGGEARLPGHGRQANRRNVQAGKSGTRLVATAFIHSAKSLVLPQQVGLGKNLHFYK